MVALIGFLMIIVIVALLLKGKMSPIVVLGVVPAIAALILGYSPVDIMGYIADGIKTTTSNGILFIFSVIFFGVLADAGLFDVIVSWLVKKAGDNVVAVTAHRDDCSSRWYDSGYRTDHDSIDASGL